MRNILDERPTRDLHGAAAFSRDFVGVENLDGKDVLDIGCGFGWFDARGARRRRALGRRPRATEHDLETARRHIDDERVSFLVAGAGDLPFPDGSFDTVVMWEVLEHIPPGTEPQAFAEIARVLRPGGRLHLSTPYASVAGRLTDPAWFLAGHRHYRRERVARLAREAGLEVETIELKGRWCTVLSILNLYLSKWLLRRSPLMQDGVQARVDEEWKRPGGFVHVFLRSRKAG